MIHPTIGELTNNGEINRYTLVVATAKCARIITDEYIKQREYAEKLALSKESEKKSTIAALIKREYRDEKAVKNAITGLHSGEFEIVKAEENDSINLPLSDDGVDFTTLTDDENDGLEDEIDIEPHNDEEETEDDFSDADVTDDE